MAFRSLTEVFILMRNNAIQNRHMFSDYPNDDRALLVKDETSIELENGSAKIFQNKNWQQEINKINFKFEEVQEKMKHLNQLHDLLVNRPGLDNVEEERRIEGLTNQITNLLHNCQKSIYQLEKRGGVEGREEERMVRNIVSSSARTLQNITIDFRTSQSAYLKRLEGREERCGQYFTDQNNPFHFQQVPSQNNQLYELSQSQMELMEEGGIEIQQREKEITQIVRSIQELNEIFRDLSAIIVDQGSILDRIDHNMEETSINVEKGLEQLQKAQKHQKKNRKMHIITFLFILCLFLFLLLLGTKF